MSKNKKRYSFLVMLYLAEARGYRLRDRKEEGILSSPRFQLWENDKVVVFGDSLAEIKGRCDRLGMRIYQGVTRSRL